MTLQSFNPLFACDVSDGKRQEWITNWLPGKKKKKILILHTKMMMMMMRVQTSIISLLFTSSHVKFSTDFNI